MNISEKLKAERKKAQLTQAQLAERLGVAMNTISRYESGERRPSIEVIQQIASALNVPASVFFDDMPETEANEYIADLAVKAQTSPALQKIIKLLNTLSAKQLLQVVLFLEALTDDPEN